MKMQILKIFLLSANISGPVGKVLTQIILDNPGQVRVKTQNQESPPDNALPGRKNIRISNCPAWIIGATTIYCYTKNTQDKVFQLSDSDETLYTTKIHQRVKLSKINCGKNIERMSTKRKILDSLNKFGEIQLNFQRNQGTGF